MRRSRRVKRVSNLSLSTNGTARTICRLPINQQQHQQRLTWNSPSLPSRVRSILLLVSPSTEIARPPSEASPFARPYRGSAHDQPVQQRPTNFVRICLYSVYEIRKTCTMKSEALHRSFLVSLCVSASRLKLQLRLSGWGKLGRAADVRY